MEWYVFRYNVNSRKIEKFNIFNHGRFSRSFDELKKKRLERDQFAKELNGILMYNFWSKYEYEVLVGELTDRQNRVEEKVDIYEQIKMNWDQFLDYATGRASPCQIGEKLWCVCEDGSEDPCEVTVCMMTQMANRAWKIRIKGENGRSWEVRGIDIGYKLFREKADADERTDEIRRWKSL